MDFNILNLWHTASTPGKTVIVVLCLMFIYMVAVGVERYLTFLKARGRSLEFIINLQQKLRDRDIKAALSMSQLKPQSPIAVVIEAALKEYIDGVTALKTAGPEDVGEFDLVDAVNRSIDRVKEREIADLKKGLGGLATIATSAPFVGLLGTVVGIINVFATMKTTGGGGGISAVAGGIGEALITTAFGLLVAIPAVMSYNWFTNSIDAFVVDMNETSSELISFMLREGRKAA